MAPGEARRNCPPCQHEVLLPHTWLKEALCHCLPRLGYGPGCRHQLALLPHPKRQRPIRATGLRCQVLAVAAYRQAHKLLQLSNRRSKPPGKKGTSQASIISSMPAPQRDHQYALGSTALDSQAATKSPHLAGGFRKVDELAALERLQVEDSDARPLIALLRHGQQLLAVAHS